ncbi:hypothetical protein [Azospirillum himalayense]
MMGKEIVFNQLIGVGFSDDQSRSAIASTPQAEIHKNLPSD